MCLILIAYRTHPRYPLIIAANRDEFFDRPTAPASFWGTAPELLAGKDLRSGGSWLGITRSGRFAAVVNYRDPRHKIPGAPSRGSLVTDFLLGSIPPACHLGILQRHSWQFNGYTMVFGDLEQLYVYSNMGEIPPLLQPGFHGLSNHLLDTPWPKVTHGREALEKLLSSGDSLPVEAIFSLLANQTMPDEALLPDTGIGLEWERLLAPIFISGTTYGTRSSTILAIDRNATVNFHERTYNGGDPLAGTTRTFRFRI